MPGITFYSEEEEMPKKRSFVWAVTGLLVVLSLVLASCAPQATAAPTQPPAAQETEPPVEPTEPPAATEPATEPAATEAAIDRNYSPDIPDPAEPVTITYFLARRLRGRSRPPRSALCLSASGRAPPPMGCAPASVRGAATAASPAISPRCAWRTLSAMRSSKPMREPTC